MREVIAFERTSYYKDELAVPRTLSFVLEQMALSGVSEKKLEEFMDDSCKHKSLSFERFLGRMVVVPTGRKLRGEARFKNKSWGNQATKNFLSLNARNYKFEPTPIVIEKLWEDQKQTLVSC